MSILVQFGTVTYTGQIPVVSNSGPQVVAAGPGAITYTGQNIGFALSRDVEQTVSLLSTYILTRNLEQTITTTQALSRILMQRVSDPLPAQDAFQWEAIVAVDGTTQNQLTGSVRVTGGENEQLLASFQIRPPSGVITISNWTAKDVTIDYADQFEFKRLFTGIVDEVEYDATENLITFTCITNRKDNLNSIPRYALDAGIGGFWSEFVFDKDADNYEYALDRISTVFAALETTPYNQFHLTPFAAKIGPDVTYTESDIIDGSIVPTFVSRDQLVNSWTLNYDYQYDRLRHRERDYSWDMLDKSFFQDDSFAVWGEYLRNPVVLLPKDAAIGAVESNEWTLKGEMVLNDLPPAGYYDVGNGQKWGWTPKSTSIKFEKDDDGNIVRDDDGDPVVATRTVKDISAVYTTAADFTLARRFSQRITEKYAVKMYASQSVSQYGEIKEDTSRGITVKFDSTAWENFEKYSNPTGSVSANSDWVIDKDDNSLEGGRASFNNAIQTAQAIIKRDVLDTHRQNYVEFEALLDPSIDLTKTVYVNTTRVQARGKVFQFEHVLDIDEDEPTATTIVKLAISKATGSQSDDGIGTPTAPTITDATFVPSTKRLYTRFGNHYVSPPYDVKWSGFITNYQFKDVIGDHNVYPVKFTVDSEKIGDEDRKEKKVAAPSTVNIEIPDELLTITAP